MKKNHPVGEGSWVKNTSSGGEVLTHNWIGRVQLKGQRQYLTDVADASTSEHLRTLNYISLKNSNKGLQGTMDFSIFWILLYFALCVVLRGPARIFD